MQICMWGLSNSLGESVLPFNFVQVPGIELRSPRLYAKLLYPVNHPICLRYVAYIEKSHRVMLFKKKNHL